MTHPAGSFAAEIEAQNPITDRVSGLLVRWQPEAGRWFIYQVLPAHCTPALVLDEKQPIIAKGTLFIPAPGRELMLLREMVDQTAWEIFKETGRYSRPFWVVQGDKGGHKRRLSLLERRVAKQMTGRAADVPVPGDLPYAPVDRRVVEALRPLDRMQGWAYALDISSRSPQHFEATERAALDTAARELWSWLEHQVDAAWEDTETYRRKIDVPMGGDGAPSDYEALKEQMISTMV